MELVEDVKELLVETARIPERERAACFWHGQYVPWVKAVSDWQNRS